MEIIEFGIVKNQTYLLEIKQSGNKTVIFIVTV